MKNTWKQIRKNLSEIKKFTNLSEQNFKNIFENASSAHLKDFLAEYNIEYSLTLAELIETNDSVNLINLILEKEIN